ncbi:hypothetical protein [Nocardioides sp.]|uniref:hypothetical protein n=1 Tax=Nocardioides sp. TaxID=35761 RepID=UPI003514355D
MYFQTDDGAHIERLEDGFHRAVHDLIDHLLQQRGIAAAHHAPIGLVEAVALTATAIYCAADVSLCVGDSFLVEVTEFIGYAYEISDRCPRCGPMSRIAQSLIDDFLDQEEWLTETTHWFLGTSYDGTFWLGVRYLLQPDIPSEEITDLLSIKRRSQWAEGPTGTDPFSGIDGS